MSFDAQALDMARVDFDKGDGLVPAIVQDADSGAVLMLGYMNREALEATLERKRVVFYSRSKQRLWEKGETSGHTLDLERVLADCDQDTLLVLARPRGPVCHTGTRTCFGDAPQVAVERLGFLATLERLVGSRIAERPAGSYTTKLLEAGTRRIAQKVGEEGVEVALAAVGGEDDKELVSESADLVYHLLVLLGSRGVRLEDVAGELERRQK